MLSNNKGMGLTQIMIAGALIAGMSTVVMQMQSNSQKTLKSSQVALELQSFTRSIEETISDKDSCQNSFSSKTIAPSTSIDLTSLKDASNTDILTTDAIVASGAYKVNQIQLNRGASSQIELALTLENLKHQKAYGPKTILRKFPIKAEFTPSTDIISSCYSNKVAQLVADEVQSQVGGLLARIDSLENELNIMKQSREESTGDSGEVYQCPTHAGITHSCGKTQGTYTSTCKGQVSSSPISCSYYVGGEYPKCGPRIWKKGIKPTKRVVNCPKV